MTETAAAYWENRYRESGRTWTGNVNASLERELAGVAPGTALDLGSGEGGDALWLARNGWSVTAVDISPFALAIGEAAQGTDDDITWIAADLATWQPPARYDLVTSCFLHSLVELPREVILRRAAEAVAPGGLLVVVGHSGVPHWAVPKQHESDHEHDHNDLALPTPDEVFAILFDHNPRLEVADWAVITSALVERPVTAPDGTAQTISDSVLTLRRS